MRVTKTIKDYINEKVETTYAGKRAALPTLDDTFHENIEKCQQDLRTLRKKWEKEAIAVCASYGFTPDVGWRGQPYDIVSVSSNYGGNVRLAVKQAEAELDEEIRKAKQDIIVELELGGDRAKLDAMLAALADRIK